MAAMQDTVFKGAVISSARTGIRIETFFEWPFCEALITTASEACFALLTANLAIYILYSFMIDLSESMSYSCKTSCFNI